MNVQHFRVYASKLLILPGWVLNKLALAGVKAHEIRLDPDPYCHLKYDLNTSFDFT
jgi:hypothetical protein